MDADSGLAQHSPAVIAILRGVLPGQVVEIGQALVNAGIRIVEVTLNSPQPLESIERLAASIGDRALIGAGTVLDVASVNDVAVAGAKFVVSPSTDPAVIAQAIKHGLEPLPGAMTPTEALTAVAAGARHLKLFPANSLRSSHIRALHDVLSPACRIWAVGGVTADNLGLWIENGAFGVGVGGSLYRPGRSTKDVRQRAEEFIKSWRSTPPGTE
jgi:2-dehydro-3-deoxyphosphogalactonate aldolase